MNILFATTSLPHARSTGAEIASQSFIDAMRMAGHRVDVLGFARDTSPPPAGSTAAEIRAIETSSAGLEKFRWLAASMLRRQPYVIEKFRSRRYQHLLARSTAKGKADVLVLDHAQMGWLLPHWQHWAKSMVFIAHNHEAPLYAAQAEQSRNLPQKYLLARDSRLLRALETQLAQAAAQIWTLSEQECLAFTTLSGPGKTSLMPLAGHIASGTRQPAEKTFDIGLLGTWAWDVNGQGLAWFIRDVLPLLPPHISIRIAGRGSENLQGLGANCLGLGFISNAQSFMASARVLAVPTISGAGIQLKTIEAVASGTPTVSTSLGVRGLPDLPGFVAIADAPDQFAAALLKQLAAGRQDNAAGQNWAKQRQHAFEQQIAEQLRRLSHPSTECEPALLP